MTHSIRKRKKRGRPSKEEKRARIKPAREAKKAADARRRLLRQSIASNAVLAEISQSIQPTEQLSSSDASEDNDVALMSAPNSVFADSPLDSFQLLPLANASESGNSVLSVLDATWISQSSQGGFRNVPGSLNFLKIVVRDPKTTTVAIYCECHREWLVSPAQHVREKHGDVHFPPDLFRDLVVAFDVPMSVMYTLHLPFTDENHAFVSSTF